MEAGGGGGWVYIHSHGYEYRLFAFDHVVILGVLIYWHPQAQGIEDVEAGLVRSHGLGAADAHSARGYALHDTLWVAKKRAE